MENLGKQRHLRRQGIRQCWYTPRVLQIFGYNMGSLGKLLRQLQREIEGLEWLVLGHFGGPPKWGQCCCHNLGS